MLSFHNLLDSSDIFEKRYCPSRPRQVNMPMDVKETEKTYHIAVDLPGINKEDVKLAIEDQKLTISFEVKENTESKEEENVEYVFRERGLTSGSRTLSFPKEANLEKIEAKFKNGVLEVTVPKVHESARVKYININ